MKTKAAVLYRLNEPLVIEEIEIPRLKMGQVLVRILYSGICGSQRNEIRGYKGTDKYLPHLMGHEASGIIEETGPGVKRVKKGDTVVLTWIKTQGLEGGPTIYKKNNIQINAGSVTTLSELAVVSENRLVKIPKNFPSDLAALLGCAIPTGSGVVINTLKAQSGSSIAIFGAGGIGAGSILGARLAGCKTIIAIDMNKDKLFFAKKLGANILINAEKENVLDKLKKVVPEGVDFSVEAAGAKLAMETAFTALKAHGTLAIAGNVPDGVTVSFAPFEFIKGKKVVGTWGGDSIPEKDISYYIKMFKQGKLPLRKMVTHRFSLDKINDAFSVLSSGIAGRILIKIN